VRDHEVTALLSRVQGRMWVDIAAARPAASCPGCRATGCWCRPAPPPPRSPTSSPTGGCRCGAGWCSTSAPGRAGRTPTATGGSPSARRCGTAPTTPAHHLEPAALRQADAAGRGRPRARLDAGRPAGVATPRAWSPSARR
jgi:hypothetical protein